MSITELRASIKEWEHKFLELKGHKPTFEDIKAENAVYSLYRRYQQEKKKLNKPDSSAVSKKAANGPATPQKKKYTKNELRTPSKNNSVSAKSLDSESDNDDATDVDDNAAEDVTELFPTPQFRGKVLSIFDMEVQDPPLTPRKSPMSSGLPQTPNQLDPTEVETPMSKKTPKYFQKVNLFASFKAADEGDLEESPLIKRRVSRVKSISAIVKEASELRSLQFATGTDENDDAETLEIDQSQSKETPENDGASTKSNSEEPDSTVTAIEPDTSQNKEPDLSELADDDPLFGRIVLEAPGVHDAVPLTFTPDTRKRKGPKRQTRKKNLKPVSEDNELVTSKPTENYVRLKIHHNNKKFKRGRR
ncbi:hypothetical protein DASB73_036590 [Starmerella bacillaris]|uniref:DNA replication regulator SLD2 n=1 Tax=Starmerella bacillaris TaxID=1247836 RepID=A0AAV5RME2_STABA|nr:hypothetical protein DASB73_036590 [Starmerella bacillaris]